MFKYIKDDSRKTLLYGRRVRRKLILRTGSKCSEPFQRYWFGKIRTKNKYALSNRRKMK